MFFRSPTGPARVVRVPVVPARGRKIPPLGGLHGLTLAYNNADGVMKSSARRVAGERLFGKLSPMGGGLSREWVVLTKG